MDKYEQIKRSPLFRVSLSSKELFHTNFISWALETEEDNLNSQVFTILFKEKLKTELIVEREKDNIDLRIKANGKIFIIENKVKDILGDKQARKIENKKADVYLLLTLLPQKFYFDMSKWKVKDYSKLIKDFSKLNITNEYHKLLFEDYIKMVQLLIDIISENIIKEVYNFNWSNPGLLAPLQELRMHDVFIKYGASCLLEYITRNININELLNCGYTFKPTFGFSHNHPIVDIFWENDFYIIGIQIEDKYYRKIFMLKKGKTEEIACELRKRNIWFDSNWKSKQKKEFCTYDSLKDSPTFMYQYSNEYFTKNTKFNEIVKLINKSMEEIKKRDSEIYKICRRVLTTAST
ncbi:hypothetical protein K7J14_14770 [Treponema zuelzerae]|uniref:PD-(D/E)XK nuclease superfamily protein n=1 Tax=Teretinema zuelzerae TaxID=156 RepID=A0AAE3JL76_9SPIR|nr:hypothetical protein [Teretinema zuelzerae]MCD1655960.1 hypothetical protein [Teretinema zuelzerae]